MRSPTVTVSYLGVALVLFLASKYASFEPAHEEIHHPAAMPEAAD